ncbi:MAG: hypothetical protein IT287_01600 [Bdellovibrionaceae bacterium]|nr:hypothetical protein [Pseudobdellovibrionaceae bacterium]
MVIESEDEDSVAEVASKLSHRLNLGFGYLLNDLSMVTLGYRYNNWQLEESRDVARLLNTTLNAHEVSLSHQKTW